MSVNAATPGAQSYTIPFANTPQTFEILLAGTTYTLTNKWNDLGQFWAIDIADQDGVMIVANIPMITGADLLAGLDYLELGGSFYVSSNGSSPDDVPTLDNLGIDSNVYFVTVNIDE